MSEDDSTDWVPVTLTFSLEEEAVLQAVAQREGLSLKCYCVHVLYRHVLKDVLPPDEAQRQRELQTTLRRNDCPG